MTKIKGKEIIKLGILSIYDNGMETWLYPHSKPIHIGVVDNMLFLNGVAVYQKVDRRKGEKFSGKIVDIKINGKKLK